MPRERPRWTEEAYEAAISAVSDKQARLPLDNTRDFGPLQTALNVLRYERDQLYRKGTP